MPDRLYVIRDWDAHFEKSDTKKCQWTKWVPLPNKHDGKSYRRLMRLRDGASLFGAWVLIVQVASRCPKRGTLADADGPLTAADIADKTGCRVEILEKALEVLCSKEIGWISASNFPGDHGNFRGAPEKVGLQDRTGQDNTRQLLPTEVCTEPMASVPSLLPAATDPATIMVFPCVGKGPTEWPLGETKLAQYRESFPGVDVLAECRKARQWCIDNPPKRKTFSGMPAFLSRWLSRVQDAGGKNGSAQGNCPAGSRASREQEREIRFGDTIAGFLDRDNAPPIFGVYGRTGGDEAVRRLDAGSD